MIRRVVILFLALSAVAAAQMPWAFESPKLAAKFSWNRQYNGLCLDDSPRRANATASNVAFRSGALYFNGTNSTLSLRPILGAGSNWTVIAALKPFSNYPSSYAVIYGEGSHTTGTQLIWCSLNATAGAAYMEIRSNAGADSNVTSTRRIADNKPHSIAFVRRTNDCRIYIDGFFETGMAVTNPPLDLTTASIGSIQRDVRSSYLLGEVYDVRLFVPGLSDSEILQLATEMKP